MDDRSLQATATAIGGDGSDDDAGRTPWRVVRPARGWGARLELRDLWSYRELGFSLALRDLQLRYRQTLFGVAWAVLQPLTAMAAFSWVFGHVASIPSDGLPYPLFVLAGVSLWFYVSGAISAAAESLVEHVDLVTRVWFPRLLAPIAAVSALGVDLVIGILLLIPVMVYYDVAPPLQALTVPLWMLAAVTLAMAVGFWLAAINVLYRDVRYALPFVLQFWIFISPIVFPTSLVSEPARYVFSLNPVVGLVDGFRWALLGAPAPGAELAVSGGALVAIAFGGIWYFGRVERIFADRI